MAPGIPDTRDYTLDCIKRYGYLKNGNRHAKPPESGGLILDRLKTIETLCCIFANN
jgi:hypothetical protein